jgi:hypothetical protein
MPLKANPKAREQWPPLPPMTPLPVEVAEAPKADKGPKFGNDQVKIHFKVFEGPYSQITITDPLTNMPKAVPGQLMVFMNLTMSATTSGQKSMLRQFVEAIYGPITDDQAYAIDLEALVGQRVVFVGNYANPNAEVLRLKPIGWSRYVPGQVGVPIATPGAPAASAFQPPQAAQPPPAAVQPTQAAPPLPTPGNGQAAVPLAPNGQPFERIENGHGLWLNGSAYEWAPIPTAPPVPPPPPAAAVAPPPVAPPAPPPLPPVPGGQPAGQPAAPKITF